MNIFSLRNKGIIMILTLSLIALAVLQTTPELTLKDREIAFCTKLKTDDFLSTSSEYITETSELCLNLEGKEKCHVGSNEFSRPFQSIQATVERIPKEFLEISQSSGLTKGAVLIYSGSGSGSFLFSEGIFVTIWERVNGKWFIKKDIYLIRLTHK